jgi:hypothetical protein
VIAQGENHMLAVTFNFDDPREAQLAIALVSMLHHACHPDRTTQRSMADDLSLEILPNALAIIYDHLALTPAEYLRDIWDANGWRMLERVLGISKPLFSDEDVAAADELQARVAAQSQSQGRED